MNSKTFTRRSILRSVGACLPLPFLEINQLRAATATPPVRLVWLYSASGMWMPEFTPEKTGKGEEWQLSPILTPLAPYKSQMNVLTGLRHANAFKLNPSINRHAQDHVCHLTGADLGRVPGISVKNSVSIDQAIAREIGENTRIPNLSVSISSNSISYNENGARIPSERRPDVIFDRLFGSRTQQSMEQMERRFRRHKSILDDLMDQTEQLNQKLGVADRDKLDAYLTSVRDVERRLQIEKKWAGKDPVQTPEGSKRPNAIPKSRGEEVRLLFDLITLALQTDQTRIVSFQLGEMGCQYPEIGAPDGYHGYTHGAGGSEDARKKMIAVDKQRVSHVAYFLQKLKNISVGEHDLLYHSFIHYGCGMSETHGEGDVGPGRKGDNLPNLTLGNAGGSLKTNQHLDYGRGPLSDLFVRMAQSAGVEMESFVDSQGTVSEIGV